MSFSSWPRAGALLTLGVIATACGGGEKVGPEGIVSIIEISPKTAFMYSVGQQQIFTTTLTTEAGTAGEGIPIAYKSRDETLIEVNSAGIATAKKKGGFTWVVTTAGGKSDSARVEVPLTSCGSTTPTTIAIAQVVTDIGATGICAAASTGEYAVIVHNNSLSGSGSSSVEVSGVAVGTPPTGGATFSMSAGGSAFGTQLRTWRRDVAAEMRHRRAEAAQVAPLVNAAASWYANRPKRASFAAAVSAVGDLVRLNVSLTNSCNDSTMIDARVAAISNKAIVLADPRNPTGGYTDAEYNEFAQMFDTVISPLDVANFGAPTDLDNNSGRVLLVFTKAINERTPAGAEFYVGGLTHSRDLFPKSGAGACLASNVAEMFYLLVPDPGATVNGNEFPKDFVTSVTNATVAHEYQHLINFARRRYLNTPGTPQVNEELWLNEGLSAVAEELLYYRLSGRTPRANIGATEVFASQAAFDLFADYMASQFLNYDEYVFRTTTTSPFEAGDDIATRGATWSFLRYAVDQKFAGDGSFWFNLVNSGESGATNVQNRLGVNTAGLLAMLRDFTVTVYTDDYVFGVDSKYTHPSWNFRSVYPGLQQPFLWPMSMTQIEDGETTTTSIQAGAFKVYRFKGLAGADSFIRVTGTSGTALPSGITISVVRTAP